MFSLRALRGEEDGRAWGPVREGRGEVEIGEGRGGGDGVVAREDRGVEVKGSVKAGEEEVGGEVRVELEKD